MQNLMTKSCDTVCRLTATDADKFIATASEGVAHLTSCTRQVQKLSPKLSGTSGGHGIPGVTASWNHEAERGAVHAPKRKDC